MKTMKKRLLLLLLATPLALASCNDASAFRYAMPKGTAFNSQEVKSNLNLQSVSLVLYVGQSKQIVDIGGNKLANCKFAVTNSKVASVDADGNVLAKQVGSTSVIIKSGNKFDVCSIIVTGEAPIDITGLSINSKPSSVMTGDEISLSYTKTPVNADNYNSIRWQTSDATVASIDSDGNLKAVSPGDVTITLLATGTTMVDSFNLTVEARESTLDLNYTDVVGLKGASDLVLVPKLFTDYRDTTPGKFSVENPNVATIADDGTVTFKNEGKTTISYTVTTGGKTLTASCKVATVYFEDEEFTVIRTPDQLQAIENTSGNYMLGNDIDLKEAVAKGGSLYHSGSGFVPLFAEANVAFVGIFDGMGYAIKNIYMNSSNAFTALFSYISSVDGKEAVIRNLSMVGGTINGGQYTAAIAGRCNITETNPNTRIENCFVDLEVKSFGIAGGIIAYNTGIVENCLVTGDVNASIPAMIAARQQDDDSIGVLNCVYADKDIDGVNSLYHNEAMENYVKLNETEIVKSMYYSSFDKSIWNVEDGKLPTLKTYNER